MRPNRTVHRSALAKVQKAMGRCEETNNVDRVSRNFAGLNIRVLRRAHEKATEGSVLDVDPSVTLDKLTQDAEIVFTPH